MGMGMKMYFHLGYETNIVFWNWSPTTAWEMVLTSLVFLLTGILFEWCKHLRIKEIKKLGPSYRRMPPCAEDGNTGAGTTNSGENETVKTKLALYSRELVRNGHLKQTALYTIEVTLSVVIMLALMTFNIYICVAAVLGRGFGYFVFSPSSNRLMIGTGEGADCCN